MVYRVSSQLVYCRLRILGTHPGKSSWQHCTLATSTPGSSNWNVFGFVHSILYSRDEESDQIGLYLGLALSGRCCLFYFSRGQRRPLVPVVAAPVRPAPSCSGTTIPPRPMPGRGRPGCRRRARYRRIDGSCLELPLPTRARTLSAADAWWMPGVRRAT